MEVVDARDFFTPPMFREEAFREAVQKHDWTQYKDKPVLIQGCGSKTLPTWTFLVLTAEVAPYAKSISYGEIKNLIPISGRLGVHS